MTARETAPMTAAEIAAFAPPPPPPDDLRAPLREALRRAGRYGPGQTAGRFHPGACAALEVTQRCNLDCTLCYLSEAAELAHDPPLALLFARIDDLARRFGPGLSVQITGGDPTLRKAEDLEALCRRIRSAGLRSCLMTNGIRASRALLARLAAAGLDDVAFHVDLTQERPGYATEAALHEVRRACLDRARGLGLRVLFDTTVFDGNLRELPEIARFFRDHAGEVALASFQMQAETGRGVAGARGDGLTIDGVVARLEEGFGAPLGFGVAEVGHEDCNRYASVLVAGAAAAALLDDAPLVHAAVAALEAADDGREPYLPVRRAAARALLRRPALAFRLVRRGFGLLRRLRRGLLAGRRPRRIALLVHNFMDAASLDRARCECCVFAVATEAGPLPMCVHNARRDRHVFAPARIDGPDGPRWWSAATGALSPEPELVLPDPEAAPLKRLKGRSRAARIAAHPNRAAARGAPSRAAPSSATASAEVSPGLSTP